MSEILVIEFLHAHSAAFERASESLRTEGRQMLISVVNDFLLVPGLSVSVAVCTAAAATLQHNLAESVSRLIIQDSANDLSTINAIATVCGRQFRYVFPIAPESVGILSGLIAALLPVSAASNACLLTPPQAAVDLCSDKWMTYQFLTENRLPTIPTFAADQLTADLFAANQPVVVKPTDGAGSENIQTVEWHELYSRWKSVANSHPSAPSKAQELLPPESWWQRCLADQPHATGSLIVQPYIAAESLSIGLIGRGHHAPPLILPLASQAIRWRNGQPSYHGGQIPAKVVTKVADEAKHLASRIADFLQINRGYVGIDLLLPHSSDQLLITEINPRLCSSYIGYRQATTTNLAELMLGQDASPDVAWQPNVVSFTVTD